MIQQLEYLKVPTIWIFIIVAFLVVSNLIGSALKLKGIIAPEFMRIKDYIKRKKQEREDLKKIPQILSETQKTLNEVNAHYNADRISMRDQWIDTVNNRLNNTEKVIKDIAEKLDKNNDITMALWIDDKRNFLLNFSSKVVDYEKPVTREQFHRAFKIYNDYEAQIEALGLSNGECEIAMKIIQEAYENHVKNHTFLEDVRGY